MTAHGIFRPPPAHNEPVRDYLPGSPERASLQVRLEHMRAEVVEIPLVIGGEDVTTGRTATAVMPHDKEHVLAHVHQARQEDVKHAIDVAAAAWQDWSRWPWEDRAAVFLRAAELLSGPWRDTLNAATMLGQSKTVHQAEIDAACESIDFFRFNIEFMTRVYSEQPVSTQGVGRITSATFPLDRFTGHLTNDRVEADYVWHDLDRDQLNSQACVFERGAPSGRGAELLPLMKRRLRG